MEKFYFIFETASTTAYTWKETSYTIAVIVILVIALIRAGRQEKQQQ